MKKIILFQKIVNIKLIKKIIIFLLLTLILFSKSFLTIFYNFFILWLL